eukprot:scaffold9.g3176.t1
MAEDCDSLEASLLAALEHQEAQEAGAASSAAHYSQEDGASSKRRRTTELEPRAEWRAHAGAGGREGAAGPSGSGGDGDMGTLGALSDPLLLAVLLRLAPDDLMTLGRCSAALRRLTGEPLIWRRLFYFRQAAGAEAGAGDDADAAEAGAWQSAYIERDAAEGAEAVAKAPPGLAEIARQMAVAKRSESAPLCGADAAGGAWLRPPAAPAGGAAARARAEAAVAAAFRASHGLPEGGCAEHACAGGGTRCAWEQLGLDAFICRASGYLHHCGEACSERVLDAEASVLVCPISGRCFEARQLCGEEGDEGEEGGGDGGGPPRGGFGGGGDWNEDVGGMGGRLGRAFYAGYYSTSEDLLRQFGVRL